MTKVLFTYDYGDLKMDKVRDLGYDLLIRKEVNLEYDEQLEDVEVLVCYNPFQTLDIKALKKLKWVQLSSIGIDQAPLDYIQGQGILLTNNRGGYSIPMGEWIVLKVLESYKDSKYFFRKQQEKVWHMNTSLLELKGKTLGFIGTGTIAMEAAKRLQGFDMHLIGLNTSGHDTAYLNTCYAIHEMERFLSLCDIIVCSIPYTTKTHHLVDQAVIDQMKDEAVLINVSRGSIIDEEALIGALKKNKFRSVALDVFEEEPLSEKSPLWDIERVYLSPHNSWISEMRNERRFEITYANLKRYQQQEQLLNVVDLKRGY